MVRPYIRHEKNLNSENFPHGTFAGYRAGCKCIPCNTANNDKKRTAYQNRHIIKEIKVDTKVCGGCNEEKSISEFYPSGNYLSPYCKNCETLRRRKYFHLKEYNLTTEQYNDLLEKQNYRCAIGKEEFTGREPYVDHCHRTGKVRGLLCSKCNFGLGQFNDDPKQLRTAASYLESWAADCPSIEEGVSSNSPSLKKA